ncbi:MAG: Eco57I restriction-modification methylase domain-containing protein, partial [Phycisphaerae bacterium]
LENEPVEGYGITVRPTQSIPDRALVDLSNNIKCGNALIGPDFFDGDRIECSNEEERFRINAFDWQTEFPHIFRKPSHQGRAREESGEGRSKNERGPLPHGRGSDHSGFDAVIGNPPYLSYSGRQSVDISDRQRSYFAKHYQTAGWMTSHGLFIERAVSDLSRRMTAFVVPDQVGHLEGYRSVREMLNHYAGLVEVRYWGESVFDEAVTPALTFLADRSHHGHTIIHQPSGGRRARIQCISGTPWISSSNRVLLAKLRHNTHSLGDRVADPGVHTGNCSRRLIVDPSAPGSMGVPILEGRLISRYRCGAPSKHLKLDYEAGPGEYFTIRDRHQYREASFVIRQTAAHPIVGPREHADYFRNSLLALYPPTDGTDVRYLVGLLNTRLIRYVYGQTVRESRQKAFPQVKVRSLRALPIRTIDRADPADRLWHDQIVDLVQRMLDLHRRRDVSHSPDLMDDIQRRIDETDRRIDGLVYKLYGLTDDEISIVEKAADQSRDREGTVISRNQRS